MSRALPRTGIAICVPMMAASVAVPTLRSTHMLADVGPEVGLETMIPARFGDWSIDASIPMSLPALAFRKAGLHHALHGEIPHGMLAGVSSLPTDEPWAFDLHEPFIDAMTQAVDPEQRWRVTGAS